MQYSFERSWFDSPAMPSIDRRNTQSATMGNALQRGLRHAIQCTISVGGMMELHILPPPLFECRSARQGARTAAQNGRKGGMECNWAT